jgi:protein phosphatase
MTAIRARRSHRAQPRRARRRRRWPIVTTSLVVLLAVVIGGGYIAYQWSQDQYYIGADRGGNVVIYRGINQHILGIGLSHPYHTTTIELTQVPSPYQGAFRATDTVSGLSSARSIVATVQSQVNACRHAYLARQAWVPEDKAFKKYQAQVTLAHKQHKKPPTPAVADPGPAPPPAAASCPLPTAFGLPASDLSATGAT